MKILLTSAGAALLLAGCSTTADEPPPPPPPAVAANGMPILASGYMEMAASGDLFEIESSRLALQRSADPTVQSFAQMLINDHGRLSQTMMDAAQSAGLTPPPPAMLPRHQEMLQRLQAAAPGSFEAAYRNEQILAHQEALTLHQTYAAQGDNAALRSVAASAVPVIQSHLNHAQSLPQTSYVPPAPPPSVGAGERG